MRRNDGGGDPVVLAQVAHCRRASDKAILVEDDDDNVFWIPKSVLHDDSEVYDAHEHADGRLVVKRWWAERDEDHGDDQPDEEIDGLSWTKRKS